MSSFLQGQFLSASDGSKKYKKGGLCLRKNVSSESESNASLVYIDSWKADSCAGSAYKVNNWWGSTVVRNSGNTLSSSKNRFAFDTDDSSDDSQDET